MSRPVPYRKTLFVCTNARADGRVSCANPGRDGEDILHALKDAVRRLGLKGKVRVARSGCLDLCAQGPNVMVFPDNVCLSAVSTTDVEAIVKQHLEPNLD